MKSVINRQQNRNIKLTIAIPKEEVKKTWDNTVEQAAKNAEITGFRKGKAPKKLVEENLDGEKVTEEVLKVLLPKAYAEAVKEHNLQPLINPKIHVESLGDVKTPTAIGEKDWVFQAITCEAPTVELGNYKDAIQKITAKSKIIVPGREGEEPKMDDIIKALLGTVTISIPQILVEQEVEQQLAHLLDDVKKLGLSLDQYLSSTGKTPQNLRDEYEQKAINEIKFEFALSEIADKEHITIEEKEIQEAIQKAKNDEERKNLEANKYLLARILRQQKTLDFLRNL